MSFVKIDARVGEQSTWDSLKACDVIFCYIDFVTQTDFESRFCSLIELT